MRFPAEAHLFLRLFLGFRQIASDGGARLRILAVICNFAEKNKYA